jgi:hypothetical protein
MTARHLAGRLFGAARPGHKLIIGPCWRAILAHLAKSFWILVHVVIGICFEFWICDFGFAAEGLRAPFSVCSC